MRTIYLLHFETKLAHAGHYIGSTDDHDARLADHAAGRGARLTAVIKQAGITWRLARTWPGGRKHERLLKRRKETPRLCPLCVGESALRRARNLNPIT